MLDGCVIDALVGAAGGTGMAPSGVGSVAVPAVDGTPADSTAVVTVAAGDVALGDPGELHPAISSTTAMINVTGGHQGQRCPPRLRLLDPDTGSSCTST